MKDRTAVNTIIGYFYQFDYSILKLLRLTNESDCITVEGIEDVDIQAATDITAIQCKYYANTEYNHSVIARPIRLMLEHYKRILDEKKTLIQYYLYGYFKDGQQKLVLPLTKEFLIENYLTYTKDKVKHVHYQDIGLSEEELDEFVGCVIINVCAESYQVQFENIMKEIEGLFKCTRFEAEWFYYNNALRVIKECSIDSNIENRKITKAGFIKRIDSKKELFNEWFMLFKGKKALLAEFRQEYFSTLNVSPFERFFLIEIQEHTYRRSELKELLFLISRKWSNLSKRTQDPFCPYVYIHNMLQQELIEIKQELHREKFKFVDGYDFYGARFSVESISLTANNGNQIKLKIINNLSNVEQVLNTITKTKEVYQFYLKEPYFELHNTSIKHVMIPIEEIKDIKEIV